MRRRCTSWIPTPGHWPPPSGGTTYLCAADDDGHARVVEGLTVTAYDLPDRCVGAYYPETNPLVPLALHDEMSKTPAYKGVPVRLEAMQ